MKEDNRKKVYTRTLDYKKYSKYLQMGLAVFLIILVLRWIDFNEFVETILSAQRRYVFVVILLLFVDRYFMAFKWRLLLLAKGIKISAFHCLKTYLVSGFIGTFLPTSIGGDVYRIFHLTSARWPANKVTATVLIERLLGLIAVSTLAVIGITFLTIFRGGQLKEVFYFIWLFFVIFGGGFLFSIRPRSKKFISQFTSRFEKYKFAQKMLDYQRAYSNLGENKKVLCIFFLFSILEQLLMILSIYLGVKALDLVIPISYFFAVVPIIMILQRLPISINSIGVQEGLYVFFFSMAGLSSAEGFSLSILMRILVWIVHIPGSLFLLYDSFLPRLFRVSGSN